VILPQFWATETRAGAAPMRAHTTSRTTLAAGPPRVVTVPHAADLKLLCAVAKFVPAHSDLVFVSFHWGIHHVPQPCDYQRVVAHAAIAAGANGILGHHPHQQQGVEIYRGAPVFYSMGNFAVHRTSSKKSGRYYCVSCDE
jgi:poly-gamma-glutamate synthesis protein (capsule biosynthesis protein)